MSEDEYTPHGEHAPSRSLRDLRLHAEELARTEADAELLALESDLRGDAELWAHLWAPALAIAAVRSGRADALDLLQTAVDGGFSQPELFDGELERHFGEDARWRGLAEQMEANIPAPSLELLEWPECAPTPEIELFRIPPDRAAGFAARLPQRESTAWDTARATLEWARRKWEHANDHVEHEDALEVLERVDGGERFACVEYSIVLSQALNALEIPARRVNLRRRHHHVGVGRGHVVSEAWVDDLDRWVCLDGQNGAYWVDDHDEPLGVLELQRLVQDGRYARMVRLVDEGSDTDAATWMPYFASVTVTGCTWAEPPFAPVFQQMGVLRTPLLIHDGADAYPSLSDVGIGTGGTLAEPELRLNTRHPYVTGFRIETDASVQDVPLADARWPLDLAPGHHSLTAAVTTPYGACSPRRVAYVAR